LLELLQNASTVFLGGLRVLAIFTESLFCHIIEGHKFGSSHIEKSSRRGKQTGMIELLILGQLPRHRRSSTIRAEEGDGIPDRITNKHVD
jgi:hypothetical protein